MNHTERKLDEARYFLCKLNETDPFFDYNLSAFINASRSVLWVMNHEYDKVEGFHKWYSATKAGAEEADLLSQMNNFRVQNTKQSGVETEYLILDYVVPDEESYPVIERMWKELEGEKVSITFYEEDEEVPESEGAFIVKGKVQMERNEKKLQRDGMLILCRNYFDLLEKWVGKCSEAFPNQKRHRE